MNHNLRRYQFGLLGQFAAITVVAITFAIARLPLSWVFKLGLLWAFLIYMVGLALRNHNPKASPPK